MNPMALPVLRADVLTVVAVGGAVLAVVALVSAVVALRRERRLAAHYAAVMAGADGTDLAAALEGFARHLAAAESRLDQLGAQASDLDGRLRRALQHTHLLRYSAFQDSGGDQSFALALLDDAGNGVVVSGLYGRGGMRVYAKPLRDGRSTYALSTEEERSVAAALAVPADR